MNKADTNTRAAFIQELNGTSANTHDQLSLGIEQEKTRKVGRKVFMTDYGVRCAIEAYRQTKNIIASAEAGGISGTHLNKILRNPNHPNHVDLVDHFPKPRRHASKEYLEYERSVAMVYQEMRRKGVPLETIFVYLRDIIDFTMASGLRASEMSDHSLKHHCQDYLEVYDFDEPITEQADNDDQSSPETLRERLDMVEALLSVALGLPPSEALRYITAAHELARES